MTFFSTCPALAHIDFYKTGHPEQYSKDTTRIVSNMTPRMSRIEGCDYYVTFGLQMYVMDWLMGLWQEFFTPKGLEDIKRFEEECSLALNIIGFNAWYLRDLHALGHMPIVIKALPEGTKVPIRVPAWTIHNTDPRFAWLPNFLETQMSAEIWKPGTTATIASIYRKVFDQYCDLTCDDPKWKSFVPFQGHDFSMRGMSGVIDSVKSGLGHILSFTGTDNLSAIYGARHYYGAKGFVAGSVPATEHSVMQASGKDIDTFKKLLKLYPKGPLSIVSDTWDFWAVITEVLPQLKEEIMARDGTLIIRPDSGDPADILTGNKNSSLVAEQKGLVECLSEIIGYTTNSKQFKHLDPHIGAIYGDSITLERQSDILERLKQKNFASTNVVLGIGSYTYQYITRDTFGLALKATFAEIAGNDVPLFKKPKTDSGTKNSAKGLVFVSRNENNQLTLKENVSWKEFNSEENLLKIKYANGLLCNNEKYEDIAARVCC